MGRIPIALWQGRARKYIKNFSEELRGDPKITPA
jgi:hypothetical protein